MKAAPITDRFASSDVIARRLLVERRTRRKVEVAFHVPRRVLSSKDEEWACLVEIRRGREPPQQLYGRGVDSLEALVSALNGAFHALRSHQHGLSWLGMLGHTGMPMLIEDDERDFVALVFDLIRAEHERAQLTAKGAERPSAMVKKARSRRSA